MAEKFLVPVYLPHWLHEPIRRLKRELIPAAPPVPSIDIRGERNVEWSFLSTKMPSGPGKALEFGCEQGYMSLLAAEKGFQVLANDLEPQEFFWRHPSVEFRQGDFLNLALQEESFDLAINCSSVEHVGVAGRYGIELDENDADIAVMNRLAKVLKSSGLLLMTAPCGQDAVMAPWCRVYGAERLPRLFESFELEREEYWIKDVENKWTGCKREEALGLRPRNDPSNPHACLYALGCFVLQKRVAK